MSCQSIYYGVTPRKYRDATTEEISNALIFCKTNLDSLTAIYRQTYTTIPCEADHCINICEMKFSTGSFVITKKYADELRNKILAFRTETATRKQVILTFITTYGLTDNAYSEQLAEQCLPMEALFM